MIDFSQLQSAMKTRLAADRDIHSVEAEGATPEEAVEAAATLLGISIKHVEYEITERRIGFLGIGHNLCRVTAYEEAEHKKKRIEEEAQAAVSETAEVIEEAAELTDMDGEAFVQVRGNGLVFMKVTPSSGAGEPVTMDQAMALLSQRRISKVDEDLVKQVVSETKGEYIQVGSTHHNIASDTAVSVTFSDDEMFAYIKVTPPGAGGIDYSFEDYKLALRRNGVTFGVKENYLAWFADHPIYREKVVAAEGERAVNGLPSYLEYYFETDRSARPRETQDGKVDYKDLGLIQNVVKDQPLAKRIPAEKGKSGKTVRGMMLNAQDGKDIPITLGTNVHYGPDGVTIIADMNGQVLYTNGKINVEEVMQVDGSVNLKTGNIIFMGSVVVSGNVEEGFSVKATGNIEVNGNVDKADLDAEGEIIVKQGIAGKQGNFVKSGKSVQAKFIENAHIVAGDSVIVTDGIINSQVDAKKRIVCEGKRASIIGGRLRAAEEISAKTLGSGGSGTETICEVGYDPENKARLEACMEERLKIQTQLGTVETNISTLETIKNQRKSLPEDKEEYLEQLEEQRDSLTESLTAINEEIQGLQEILNSLKNIGRISASTKVYPGVVVVIRDTKETIQKEYKAITFVLEENAIHTSRYSGPKDSG